MKTKKHSTIAHVLEMAKPHKKTIAIVTVLSLLINIGELVKLLLEQMEVEKRL